MTTYRERLRRMAKQGEDFVRISLDVSKNTKEIIEQLEEMCGVRSKADVLRRAINLLYIAKEAEKRGEAVALIEKTGAITRLANI